MIIVPARRAPTLTGTGSHVVGRGLWCNGPEGYHTILPFLQTNQPPPPPGRARSPGVPTTSPFLIFPRCLKLHCQ